MARPAAPKDESERQKFVRLAQGRVNKVLDALDSLARLGNPSAYEYTVDDVEYIHTTIAESALMVKEKMLNPSTATKSGFVLEAEVEISAES